MMDLVTKIFLINLVFLISISLIDKFCMDEMLARIMENISLVRTIVTTWVAISLMSIPTYISYLIVLF